MDCERHRFVLSRVLGWTYQFRCQNCAHVYARYKWTMRDQMIGARK